MRLPWIVSGSMAALVVTTSVASAQILFGRPAGKSPATVAASFDQAKEDTKALTEARLKADDPAGMIAYFKERSLSDADLNKIRAVIKRMGDEDFEERIKASQEAETFGPAAIGPLRTASKDDPDAEVAYRAGECLKRIEKSVSHAAVASAAARALTKSKAAGGAAALLTFLPMADNYAVDEDIRLALKDLVFADGKPIPAALSALTDANPLRRSAAAVALVEASASDAKLLETALTSIRPAAVAETDSDAAFRIGMALATKAKSAEGLTALVNALPGLPRGRIWQVEDLLLQMAGDKAPKTKMGPDRVALEKARDDWKTWLTAQAANLNLAKFEYKPRTTGRIVLMTMDQNWGSGRIIELGADMKPRWRIAGITQPADFRMLPNGRVEVWEQNYSRITERDTRGTILTTRALPDGQPVSLQVLDNGNILMGYRQSAVEYDAKWVKVNSWARNNGDILAVARLGTGPTVVLVQNQNPGGALIRLDEKFKELPNPVKVGSPFYQAKLELLPNDRALLTEQQKVVEIDMKTGKEEWKYVAQNPTCVQRLPSGNTIVVDMGNRVVKEVTTDGTVVWQYTPEDILQPVRAYRQ